MSLREYALTLLIWAERKGSKLILKRFYFWNEKEARGFMEGEAMKEKVISYEMKTFYFPYTKYGLIAWLNTRLGKRDFPDWEGKRDWDEEGG